jgi:phage tail protein X
MTFVRSGIAHPGLGRFLHGLLSPWVFVPVAAVIYMGMAVLAIRENVDSTKGRAEFLSGDAKAYLAVARDFAAGDWSMDYVRGRPHRQPLYPAALVPVLRGGEDFFRLALVNLGIATAGFLVVYAGALVLSRRRVVAAGVGLLYLGNGFLFDQVTAHFMTEPLHITLMGGVIFAFLAFLRDNRAWQLLVTAALVGLDYLTRPNGLFVMLAMAGALGLRDAWRVFRMPAAARWGCAGRMIGLYAAAALVFVIVTIPTWVPRERIFGNPIHHGYLTNYLWVDTYEQGHSDGTFTWRDYARTHTVGDAVRRAVGGIWNVGASIPFRMELRFPALFLLGLGGFLLALGRGPASFRVLAVFGLVQLLPLMWTNVSNPNDRVPYASTMPLELAFAGLMIFALEAGLRSAVSRVSGTGRAS